MRAVTPAARALGYGRGMTAPTALAYWIIGGVLAASLLAPAIIGSDGWLVPLVVLPFGLVYAAFDKKLRDKEASGEASAH